MNIALLVVGIVCVALVAVVFVLLGSQKKQKQETDKIREDFASLTAQKDGMARENAMLSDEQDKLNKLLSDEREKSTTVQSDLSAARREREMLLDQIRELREQRDVATTKLDEEKERSQQKQIAYNTLEAEQKALVEKLDTQKEELRQMQEKFRETFENLANRIFEEKSTKFTEQNRTRLEEILKPLRENISKFESRIEETNKDHIDRNATLVQQIKSLRELNNRMSEEAHNLTKALKGDVKVMGNWGEVILKRILESSGLREGIEYEAQGKGMGLHGEDGSQQRPDYIIKLPEDKHLIIDSKVSLVAYERLTSEDEPDKREQYQKDLQLSVRKHINELHDKHYEQLKGLNAPAFVLMFIPIEGVSPYIFQPDSSLFDEGLKKKIVIVSPSTLLATLLTVAHTWRQENQTKNAMEIARQGGDLYDKFVLFVEELQNIEKHIKRTDEAYQQAMKKLSTGKGNLVGRTERLKKLGLKTAKQLDAALLDQTEVEESEED